MNRAFTLPDMVAWIQSDIVSLPIQTGLGVALLWLFLPKRHKIPGWRILVAGLALPVINLGIESGLQDLLEEGTLPLQGVFFILVMYGLGGVPFPRAVATIFCLFHLMLGWGLLQRSLPETGPDEERRLLRQGLEERPEGPVDTFVDTVLVNLLHHRMLALRDLGRDLVYGPPPADPPNRPPAPRPSPTPHSPAAAMSGDEFLALFMNPPPDPPEEDPARVSVTPPPDPASTPDPPFRPPPTPEWTDSGPDKVTSEHLSSIVKVRNKSTDPRYDPPDYVIGAVGIGVRGKYAIVDGEFLTEGSILRTGLQNPRGWRLTEITPTTVFWQPLR